jgi:hypothetical protein
MAKRSGIFGKLALLCAVVLVGAPGCGVSAVAVGAGVEQSAPVGPPETISENPSKSASIVTHASAPIEQPEKIDIKKSLSGLTLKELITRLTENEITLVDEKIEIYQAEEERYFSAILQSRKDKCPSPAFAYKKIKCSDIYYSINIHMTSISSKYICMPYNYIMSNLNSLYVDLQPEKFEQTYEQKNPRGNNLVHLPIYSSFISELSGAAVLMFPSMHEEPRCATEIFIDQTLPQKKD